MQFYTARIHFYNETTEQIDTDFMALSAKSFGDAATQIEDYYGDDLEDIELSIINPDHGFIIIDEDMYKDINERADI